MGGSGEGVETLRRSLLMLIALYLTLALRAYPLTFDEVCVLSRDTPEVRSAYHQLREAEAQLRALRGRYGPSLEMYYNYIYLQPEISIVMPTMMGPMTVPVFYAYNYQWGWRLRKLIYSSQLNDGIKAAELQVKARRYALIAQMRTSRLKAIDMYLDLYRARELLKVADSGVRLAQELFRTTEELYDKGLSPRYELLRAESLLREAESRRAEAEKYAKLALSSLSAFLNLQESSESEELSDLAGLSPQELISIMNYLLSESIRELPIDELPEVRALVVSKEALMKMSNSKQSLGKPTIAIALEEVNQRRTLMSRDWSFRAVLSVSMPLYDSGVSQGEAESLSERANDLEAQLQRVRSQLELLKISSMSELRSSLLSLRASLSRLRAAEQGYEIAKVRYESGVGTQLELINARNELVSARVALAQQKASSLKAIVRFLESRGYEVSSWRDILAIKDGRLPPNTSDFYGLGSDER